MNPVAAGEPRSPRGGRARGALMSRAWVVRGDVAPPPPGVVIAAHRSKTSPRRHDVALGRGNIALGTSRKGCGFSRAAATVTHSPRRARRICMTPN